MQYLGQHFLKNNSAIKKIIAALDIKSEETVIEIGPGKGALTLPLAEECVQKKCQLIAIEKDTQLAKNLGENSQFTIHNSQMIEGDALKILPELVSKLKIVNYKLVGNIPYYITGKLLRTISELKNKPALSVLMVQKEVAERITAGSPKNNLLAAATQYWANPKIILRLKAKEFNPPPEVDSAVIQLTTNNRQQTTQKEPAVAEAMAGEAEKYYKLIHIVFKQPRKTLANNLKDGLNISRVETEKILNSIDVPLNSRPQDVSVEQILKMADILPI